jgi:hypothetical protein
MKRNLRHPGATTRISDNWADHRARGSLGGTDFVDSYGTPVHAALDAAYVSIVDNSPDGSGGRVCRVTGPDGDSVERLHHHAVTAYRGQRVNAEDVVGISGASAYGSNYGTGGPHIHEHGISAGGVRFNLEPYYWFLSGGSAPASGSNATPITEEDNMPDAATTEQIVLDRGRQLLREDGAYREAFKALVSEALTDEFASAHENIAGRLDRTVTPLIQKARQDLADAVATLTSRLQREERERLYRNTQTGQTFSLDPELGVKRTGTGPNSSLTDAEIATLKRLQIIGLDERVIEISTADEKLLTRAA